MKDISPRFLVSGTDLWQWYQQARETAQSQSIPMTEVDWLLRELAGLDALTLRLGSFQHQPQLSLQISLADLYQRWQQRVEQRVPVQYLVGLTPWRQFTLQVSPAVLIPRPETEGLIDLALAAVAAHPVLASGPWADLGTGSGAIALGLAVALPQANLHAIDASPAALAVAQENAIANGLGDRIQFYQGSWFTPLEALRGQLRGMVSNPPYIPSHLVLELQPEVVRHEPHTALDGGPDGLDCIRHLVQTAPDYLCPGGLWLIEMMAGQGKAVAQLLQAQGCYREIQIHSDLAGLDRYAIAYFHP